MAENWIITKDEQRERKNIVHGAKSHIKSIQAALKKYLAGSPSERDYAIEHLGSLKYYLEKL